MSNRTKAIRCTMVMTKFAAEVLLRFLASGLTSDKSKDSHYSKVDQLPPFDLTLLFTNESGWASYQRVLGVEFVTSADIYSIQDMLTEQSVSYLATDITPLLPLNFSSFYRLSEQTDKTRSLRPMKPKAPRARAREGSRSARKPRSARGGSRSSICPEQGSSWSLSSALPLQVSTYRFALAERRSCGLAVALGFLCSLLFIDRRRESLLAWQE